MSNDVAAAVFQIGDRRTGLNAEQTQFLAGRLQRRLVIPESIAQFADELWEQASLDPDVDKSHNIVPSEEQRRVLLETMQRSRPDGDNDAWDALIEALSADLSG